MQKNYIYATIKLVIKMVKKKEEAVKLIKDKLNRNSFLTYKEIALITGYHPKYILKLKDLVVSNKVSFEHGNKNKKPINTVSDEEKEKIINLYNKSNVSIRKFCNFYNSRSYSCIYNIIKGHEKKGDNLKK